MSNAMLIPHLHKALFFVRNLMQRYKLTILFLLFASDCIAQKRQYGIFYNKWHYWGPMFVLKADSTFKYTERTNAGKVTTTRQVDNGVITTTTDSLHLCRQQLWNVQNNQRYTLSNLCYRRSKGRLQWL
jgi:hypothetical protein